ncbi:MAG: SDR family NAD(P)-dependent oxidoreductase [Candidatus Obscuribacterales bacterium]|nr:SDR family NAD(P)-dependent oxidoreductase [Cyanobacteria bacterium SZAS LIN-5]RTL45437.1 MAG: SDR family NAD(P)-dependent oxidoreductase [Candidatus Melainabacteria bacterium]
MMDQTPGVRMKTVIITGATGFVGANLARRLLQDGCAVHLIVRPQYSSWRIDEVRSECRIHEIDLQDAEPLQSAVAKIKPDWIFHLAANGAYSWQTDVREIINTNLIGTVNLVQSCLAAGFESFVNTGSSSEYGFKDHAPVENEYIEPNSYYAVAKSSATMFCQFMARSQKVQIPTLRLYSIYGPYEEPNRLMPTIIINGLAGKLPPLVDPNIARDYVSAHDCVEAYLLAASSKIADLGAVYNVGSQKQTSLAEVVEVARNVLNITEAPNWGSMPNRKWDTSVWVSNSEKIKADLGWQARDSFEQGFSNMVSWFNENPEMRKFYEEKIHAVASSK